MHAKFNDAFKKWFGNSVVTDMYDRPEVVYHGTSATVPFTTFKLPKTELGIHVGTLEQASLFAQNYPQKGWVGAAGPRLYPLYASIQRPYEMPDRTTWEPGDLFPWLIGPRRGILDDDVRVQYELELADAIEEADETLGVSRLVDNVKEQYIKLIRAALTAHGYDGVKYLNAYEGEIDTDYDEEYDDDGDTEVAPRVIEEYSYIVWNPAQLKSAVGNRGTWDMGDPDILHGINAFGGLSRR